MGAAKVVGAGLLGEYLLSLARYLSPWGTILAGLLGAYLQGHRRGRRAASKSRAWQVPQRRLQDRAGDAARHVPGVRQCPRCGAYLGGADSSGEAAPVGVVPA